MPDPKEDGIMSGYFKPLRRKIGVLMLVMACAFAVAWMRSLYKCDNFCRINANSRDTFTSVDGELSLSRLTWIANRLNETGYIRLFGSEYYWLTRDISSVGGFELDANGKRPPHEPFNRDFDVEWCWDWAGFTFGAATRKPDSPRVFHVDLYSIPYWSIVIPLTLLSAWLLLSKVRQKQKQTIEKVTEPAV
jgi:hypothetical protein